MEAVCLTLLLNSALSEQEKSKTQQQHGVTAELTTNDQRTDNPIPQSVINNMVNLSRADHKFQGGSINFSY